MADFSAKTQNKKRGIDHVLVCIYEVAWEPVLICSIQNTARKNNYWSRNGKILKRGQNGHFGKFCKGYDCKALWKKWRILGLIMKVSKKLLRSWPNVYVWTVEPILKLLSSMQNMARESCSREKKKQDFE